MLKEVAIIVEEVFLGSRAASTRFGGDEFIILMPGYSLEDSSEYGETLRAALESNVFVREGLSAGEPPLNIEGVITCSVGIASLERENGNDPNKMKETLIRAADTAVYRAKDLGKNRVCLAKGLDASG